MHGARQEIFSENLPDEHFYPKLLRWHSSQCKETKEKTANHLVPRWVQQEELMSGLMNIPERSMQNIQMESLKILIIMIHGKEEMKGQNSK